MILAFIRGATAYEAQIVRICISIRRPSFWLFSSNRHRFYKRPENRGWAKMVGRGPTRGWLYAWPICIRITDKEGNFE